MSVASFSAADADGRDLQGGSNFRGESGNDNLHNYGKRAGLLHGAGIKADSLGFLRRAPFYFVSAFLADVLREHADVGEDRNACGNECLDLRGDDRAAFELHSLRAGFNQSPCAGHGLLGRAVGIDRKIGDNKCALRATRHRRGVANHVVEGYRCGVRVA